MRADMTLFSSLGAAAPRDRQGAETYRTLIVKQAEVRKGTVDFERMND
jgi:hypothetical protein